ncbi:hypothetical protein [Lactobacillus sp. ESL0681]|uniref:hypothetical protein n=1 Tax=Lactobacillus sp. ESL0681 TaxID=2983211 RepID=UPI0023F95B5B|nr:hypothetical protein [Lactobacillus sp. ESL0681]WEV40604.1 hypothetical protein OZX59_01445 [Lactobacillus sp. ESL0681]
MRRIKKVWQLFWVQLYLELKSNLRYLPATLSQFLIYAGALVAIMLFSDTSEMGKLYHTNNGVFIILIGYLFWSLGISQLGSCAMAIESNEKAGILESEVQSVFPLWLLYLIQALADSAITWLYLIVLSIGTCLFTSYSLGEMIWLLILTFILSLISNVGMFGLGLIFAAGSLRFKQLGQWSTIFQAILLMVSNVYLPICSVWQELVPYVGGVELVRKLFLGQRIFTMQIVNYLLVNLVWLIIGIFIFNYFFKKERKNGSFEAF